MKNRPGERTLKNFLKTAIMPMGQVLYVFGGGWNFRDTGASELTRRIGLSSSWIRFFDEQDMNYTYRNDDDKSNSYYPYGQYNWYSDMGLDCSGYIGWVLYNTLYKADGHEGFVMPSTKMAKSLAEKGWGIWSKKVEKRLLPGDIVSKNGHVWFCIGTCEDGSVVIAHSTPSDSRIGQPGGGVQLSALGDRENCEAYKLADYYMKTYYPKWYERYLVVVRSLDDYMCFEAEYTGVFSWAVTGRHSILSDVDGLQKMDAKEVLHVIFET